MRNPKDWQTKSKFPGADELNYSQKSNAKAIRPQKPSDNTVNHQKWTPGSVPVGGYRSMFCFEDSYNSKISSTTKPEKNRII
jgi:hypothetical protein